ncbi:MAG: T6SS phospholipase effector Tle1-like catalytic domain-containing protein [Sulfuricaulis sp.]
MLTTADTGVNCKNLVVCCDGTDNEFGAENTNVVQLFSLLRQHPATQLAFYHPGLGTFPASGAWTPLAKWFTRRLGAAFGFGLSQNIADAYGFLMQNYVPGDRIYLFGFSRGAYTVRVLAALIHVCGLMHRSNANLIPYAIELFLSEAGRRKQKNDRAEQLTAHKQPLQLPVCTQFKRVFSVTPAIHFLGVWDTVASVGTIYDPFNLPYTRWNPSVLMVRHAISIDEQRKFFRTNLWSRSPQSTDVKQLWFAGDHADVGGGYARAQGGLARIALAWMLDEARAAQLQIDDSKSADVLLDKNLASTPADALAPLHNELNKRFWKMIQWIPRRHWVRNKATGQFALKWDCSPKPTPRHIDDGALMHRAVFERLCGDRWYRPVNLPANLRDDHGMPLDWKQILPP